MITIAGACILAWIGVTLGIALRRAIRLLMTGQKHRPYTPPRGAFPVLPPRNVGGDANKRSDVASEGESPANDR